MSQLETNPLANPTTVVTLPTQVMEVLPPTIMDTLDLIPLNRNNSGFSIQQLDWVQLAKKNKYLATFNWTRAGAFASWISFNFTVNTIKRLSPVARQRMNYANASTLMISIKPTSNAFFQGYSNLYWDPAPTSDYYNDILGITINSELTAQFKCYPISPKTSDEINLLVPINFPFDYMLFSPGSSTTLTDYFDSYRFGSLRAVPFSPLATTSALVQLTYIMSGQVMDLKTAGTYFR